METEEKAFINNYKQLLSIMNTNIFGIDEFKINEDNYQMPNKVPSVAKTLILYQLHNDNQHTIEVNVLPPTFSMYITAYSPTLLWREERENARGMKMLNQVMRTNKGPIAHLQG
ncbi:unnamed protein product [Cuscuta europaea]|uniref:Uncharacterized protein n=1 Tax=Cuscuta europaea TaxID=41803 RepID=A0A9P0Z5W0_CUSEU|nr:unnamed protein product [Cuscuta europaea]